MNNYTNKNRENEFLTGASLYQEYSNKKINPFSNRPFLHATVQDETGRLGSVYLTQEEFEAIPHKIDSELNPLELEIKKLMNSPSRDPPVISEEEWKESQKIISKYQ